jgi:hypothetical protein
MADPAMFDGVLGDLTEECGFVARNLLVPIDLGDIRGRPLADLLPVVLAALEFFQ